MHFQHLPVSNCSCKHNSHCNQHINLITPKQLMRIKVYYTLIIFNGQCWERLVQVKTIYQRLYPVFLC
jgi:hypothetical protein